MSSSSCEIVQEVKKVIQEDTIPKWLESFMGKTFFDKCKIHEDMQKNDINRYCITCDKSTCRFCVTSGPEHSEHKLLTIYRHVYQDVVPLSEMESYMSCRNIQHYKCNKKWVVSLTPLPHNGSGFHIEGDGACAICKRKLTDHDRFRFCSIACKFQAITGKVISKIQPRVQGGSTSEKKDEVEVEVEVEVESGSITNFRKRSRKGVPHRAPFF